VIYLDSSALLTLLFEEPESSALADWLSQRTGTPRISSQLAVVEVGRATRRLDPQALGAARSLLRQLDMIPMTGAVLDLAAGLGDPFLRSPDAIHLASALAVAETSAFVAYDHRLLTAAAAEGLEPNAPGSR